MFLLNNDKHLFLFFIQAERTKEKKVKRNRPEKKGESIRKKKMKFVIFAMKHLQKKKN